MHRILFQACLGAILGAQAIGSAAAASPRVEEVVAEVQAVYDKTRDLKGKFKQVYTDELYQRQRTHFGYVWVKKPGKMRWNYAWPEPKYFISDGKTLWFYEPKDKQAFKNQLGKETLSGGLAFLVGSGKLAAEFELAFATEKKDLIGSPSQHVLKLTPKVPTTQFKYMLLAVGRKDHIVEESMLVTAQARNHFIFDQLKFNTGVQNWRFAFKPPADVRVVGAGADKKAHPLAAPAAKQP